MTWHLKLSERIFIMAGLFTLISVPFLQTAGPLLWAAVKVVYLLGLVALFVEKKK